MMKTRLFSVLLQLICLVMLVLASPNGQDHAQKLQQINDKTQRPPLRRQQAVDIEDDEFGFASNQEASLPDTVTSTTRPPANVGANLKQLPTRVDTTASGKRIMLSTIVGSIILPPALRAYGPRLIEEGRVILDGGRYVGFLRDNFEFTIPSVEPGSYLVDVDFPALLFQPIRVDVNSKSKARGRQVDLQMVRTNEELKAPYPLKVYAVDRAPYFAKREQWRVTDIFMNPMVLMMLVPAVLMYVVPKMQQNIDPEVRQEMERVQGQSPLDMMSNLLGGGSSAAPNNAGGGARPAIKSSNESGSGAKPVASGDERERRKKRT